jgi:hypothetical protein
MLQSRLGIGKPIDQVRTHATQLNLNSIHIRLKGDVACDEIEHFGMIEVRGVNELLAGQFPAENLQSTRERSIPKQLAQERRQVARMVVGNRKDSGVQSLWDGGNTIRELAYG